MSFLHGTYKVVLAVFYQFDKKTASQVLLIIYSVLIALLYLAKLRVRNGSYRRIREANDRTNWAKKTLSNSFFMAGRSSHPLDESRGILYKGVVDE